MTIQPFIKRGTRSNATARGLIATSQHAAPHVWASTYFDADNQLTESVTEHAGNEVRIGGSLVVLPAQAYYLVAGKFAQLYYVVWFNDEQHCFQCSASDANVQARCISRVITYRKGMEGAA